MREYSDDMHLTFLSDYGYRTIKTEKRGKFDLLSKPPKADRSSTIPSDTENEIVEISPDTDGGANRKTEPSIFSLLYTVDKLLGLDDLIKKFKKSLVEGVQEKFDKITEDEQILLLRAINVQANLSDAKKDRLLLIKFLLL